MRFIRVELSPETIRFLEDDRRNLKISALRKPIHLHRESTFEAPVLVHARIDDYSRVNIGAFASIAGARIGNVKIGRYVAIGDDVRIGANEHPTDRLTISRIPHIPTMHGWHKILDPAHAAFVEANPAPYHAACPITDIGHDVWIGYRAYIKAGVRIGHGVTIGAESVVTKDVPPYTMVAGNPAKPIRMRFPDPVIERLLRVQWWDYCLYDMFRLPLADINQTLDRLEEWIERGEIQPYAGRIFRPQDFAKETIAA